MKKGIILDNLAEIYNNKFITEHIRTGQKPVAVFNIVLETSPVYIGVYRLFKEDSVDILGTVDFNIIANDMAIYLLNAIAKNILTMGIDKSDISNISNSIEIWIENKFDIDCIASLFNTDILNTGYMEDIVEQVVNSLLNRLNVLNNSTNDPIDIIDDFFSLDGHTYLEDMFVFKRVYGNHILTILKY